MSLKELPKVVEDAQPTHADEFFTPHALECMKRAVAEAVADHHRVGNPIYVWWNGSIMRLYPDGRTEPVEA